jgi:hypothetical protein
MDDVVSLDPEQREEIFCAIQAITAELKRLVESAPGHERTAVTIGTNLATIHATLTHAERTPSRKP